jgi:hypothetical protein
MHDLCPSKEMDAKMPSHEQHNDHVLVQNMYPSNMPMQYLMKGGSFDANWLYCEAIKSADIRAEHASTEGDE